MSKRGDDDPWALHYHIAFMTGRTVGLQVGFLLGVGFTLLGLWLFSFLLG